MKLELHARQTQAFSSPATELLFGGAAGGGKSHLIRVAAIVWCHAIQGLQFYLFRRQSPDLLKNHMEGPSGFPELLAEWIDTGYASINYSKNYVEIGKSKVHLCHCQHEKDVYKYQGAEIHVLAPDELTHFTESQYRYLRSRVRMAGVDVPERFRGQFPRVLAATNPGGVGHNWVKATFVDPAPPMEMWDAEPSDGGMRRQFIPSLLADNPTLALEDPHYADKLRGLFADHLVRAMLTGDWDIVAGGMFDDVWSERNVIRGWPIKETPHSWRIDRAFDWGSTRPFSVGWWAESDGTTAPDGRTYPRGSLVRLAEWYGWKQRPNEGMKMEAGAIGAGIVEREAAMGIVGRVQRGPADASVYDVEPGQESIAARMSKQGAKFVPSDKKPGSRKSGWDKMRTLMKQAGDPELPGLYIFESCRQFIRTIPTLVRDEKDPDDVDTHAEDHVADETRYRILAVKREFHGGAFRVV